MVQEVWNVLESALGLGLDELSLWHMALRAVVVYLAALAMLRLGEKRFLGKNTAFDVILAIVLGSVVSRAITGNAPFFPTLGAGFILVALHWLFAWLAFRSDRFGTFVKGNSRKLIENGKILWEAMRRSNISEKDLLSALRSQASITDPTQIKLAQLERSGDISVIQREKQPEILEVKVREGVQTVRIQLEL